MPGDAFETGVAKKAIKTLRLSREAVIALFVEIEEIVSQNLTRDSDGNWRCLNCDFKSAWSTNVKQHIESKHVSGIQLACGFCDKISPTRHALAMHIRRYHKFCPAMK